MGVVSASRKNDFLRATLDDPEYRATIEARLDAYSRDELGPRDTPCRVWTAGRDRHGYGSISLCRNGEKVSVPAHRASFVLKRGRLPNPDTPSVLHRCDVRTCIAEGHLYEGTTADNMADRDERGRAVDNSAFTHTPEVRAKTTATKRAKSRFVEADIRFIRAARGVWKQAELASIFGCSFQMISAIQTRKVWADVV